MILATPSIQFPPSSPPTLAVLLQSDLHGVLPHGSLLTNEIFPLCAETARSPSRISHPTPLPKAIVNYKMDELDSLVYVCAGCVLHLEGKGVVCTRKWCLSGTNSFEGSRLLKTHAVMSPTPRGHVSYPKGSCLLPQGVMSPTPRGYVSYPKGSCLPPQGVMSPTTRGHVSYPKGSCLLPQGVMSPTPRGHVSYPKGSCLLPQGVMSPTPRGHVSYPKGSCLLPQGVPQGVMSP